MGENEGTQKRQPHERKYLADRGTTLITELPSNFWIFGEEKNYTLYQTYDFLCLILAEMLPIKNILSQTELWSLSFARTIILDDP